MEKDSGVANDEKQGRSTAARKKSNDQTKKGLDGPKICRDETERDPK